MADTDWDSILKEFLDFSTVKSDISDISNNVKIISAKILELEKQVNFVSQQLLEQNNKIESVAQYVTEQMDIISEQSGTKTDKSQPETEQPELPDQQVAVQPSTPNVNNTIEQKPILIASATGRYREVLSILINEGFFTYARLAARLNISQSRVRAYIADLKKYYSIPISSIRDTEGVKVGISQEYVDQILGVR